jgi:uncharacterized membrane protein
VKNLIKSIKSVLLTGLLIVLPAWLATLLFLKVLMYLKVLIKPITAVLPEGINHPTLLALVAFLLTCFIVGILFHTTIGKLVGKAIENAALRKIPGYSSLRNIANQIADFESEAGFKPALVEIEDGCLSPAFVIESHDNGFVTVFVPSVPTPMAGNILIMPRDRVHLVDVTVPAMMKCISKWGAGSSQIIDTKSFDSISKKLSAP